MSHCRHFSTFRTAVSLERIILSGHRLSNLAAQQLRKYAIAKCHTVITVTFSVLVHGVQVQSDPLLRAKVDNRSVTSSFGNIGRNFALVFATDTK